MRQSFAAMEPEQIDVAPRGQKRPLGRRRRIDHPAFVRPARFLSHGLSRCTVVLRWRELSVRKFPLLTGPRRDARSRRRVRHHGAVDSFSEKPDDRQSIGVRATGRPGWRRGGQPVAVAFSVVAFGARPQRGGARRPFECHAKGDRVLVAARTAGSRTGTRRRCKLGRRATGR